MASRLRVTSQELRKRANELENLNTAFLAQVSGLKEDEARLSGSYQGDAQKQFHIRFVKDVENFQAFSNAIRRYIEQLRADADSYDAAERRNVAIAQTNR